MEQNKNTNEHNSVQPEKQQLERYDVIVDSIIEGSKLAKSAEERLDIARVLLAELRSDAEGGYVKNSDGEPYSLAQYDEQLSSFAYQINLPEGERDLSNPALLIPRSEGMRGGIMKLMENELTAQPFLDAVAEQQRTNTPEALERIKEVSKDMGSSALEAVEVVRPKDDIVSEYDYLFNPDYTPSNKTEDAAVRFESDEDRLARERRLRDKRYAALQRVGRPEMN